MFLFMCILHGTIKVVVPLGTGKPAAIYEVETNDNLWLNYLNSLLVNAPNATGVANVINSNIA